MDDTKTCITIAAVCMHSQPLEIERNLDRIAHFVSEASRKKVDIICFPELSVTGYILRETPTFYSASLTREIIERLDDFTIRLFLGSVDVSLFRLTGECFNAQKQY